MKTSTPDVKPSLPTKNCSYGTRAIIPKANHSMRIDYFFVKLHQLFRCCRNVDIQLIPSTITNNYCRQCHPLISRLVIAIHPPFTELTTIRSPYFASLQDYEITSIDAAATVCCDSSLRKYMTTSQIGTVLLQLELIDPFAVFRCSFLIDLALFRTRRSQHPPILRFLDMLTVKLYKEGGCLTF